MKLTTRGRYGARILLHLALNSEWQPITLREIAQRQQISLAYLEHLVMPLVTSGLVRSTRGPKGGISLTRTPEEIKLSEVYRIFEGSISPAECIDNPDTCTRSDICATRDLWGELKEAMASVLEATTLHDLAERQKKKGQAKEAVDSVLAAAGFRDLNRQQRKKSERKISSRR
jgi:Rrf2 family protein